jgi:hypothetical protein
MLVINVVVDVVVSLVLVAVSEHFLDDVLVAADERVDTTNTVVGMLCTFPLVEFRNNVYSFVSCIETNHGTSSQLAVSLYEQVYMHQSRQVNCAALCSSSA